MSWSVMRLMWPFRTVQTHMQELENARRENGLCSRQLPTRHPQAHTLPTTHLRPLVPSYATLRVSTRCLYSSTGVSGVGRKCALPTTSDGANAPPSRAGPKEKWYTAKSREECGGDASRWNPVTGGAFGTRGRIVAKGTHPSCPRSAGVCCRCCTGSTRNRIERCS